MKDGASKSSMIHHALAKPRPVPRKRNQPKPDSVIQNDKPDKFPPKPVLLPKPRRPPPNAPSIKLSEPGNNNENDHVELHGMVNKQSLMRDKSEKVVQSSSIAEDGKTEYEATVNASDGTSNLVITNSVEDEQRYEPSHGLKEEHMRTTGTNCSPQESLEDEISTSRAEKVVPPSPRKRSAATRDFNPPVSPKINVAADQDSPPISCKITKAGGKVSPPVPRKNSGVGLNLSPQLPRKSAASKQEETVIPNLSPRILESNNRSRPLPPKKPLPSLPKGLSGQSATTETSVGSKPSLLQKPAPELAPPPSANDSSQSSVAALAQKLSTMSVFPFHDGSSGKAGVFPPHGISPRSSALSSPRPTIRNQPSASLLEKSETKAMGGVTKVGDSTKPKIHPKPGALQEKPQNPEDDAQRHPPVRPSPSSAEAMSKVRSRTEDSLEGSASGTELRKKRLATQRKTILLGGSPLSDAAQANRRRPPLPPGSSPMINKPMVVKGPPLPAVPRPRPASSVDQTQRLVVKTQVCKSVSVGDIPKVSTAEEQSEYSYAYEHTLFGANPPKPVPSDHSQPTVPLDKSDGAYVTPDENIVNEFMGDLQAKQMTASYDVADEEAVAGFMMRKQTLNGLTCDLSSDESDSSESDEHEYSQPPLEENNDDDDGRDSDDHEYQQLHVEENEDDDDDASSQSSFSSDDSSNDYCAPPENVSPPEPPAHSKEYEEVDSIYSEPAVDSTEDSFFSDNDNYSNVEEPLYQVYNRCTLNRERSISRQRLSSNTSLGDEAFLEELAKGTLRNMRVLWSELPEVKASGILDSIKPEERKRQEAMFEVITSEASYIRSLNILLSRFMKSEELSSGSSLCVLERGQSHVLFSNISSIKSVSENFLQALRARQKEAVVISSISDIIEQYANHYFEVYVKYCSNQIYQDRTLKNLRKSVRFVEAVKRLQSVKEVQGLTLQSFLVLPMQRITRLPLLVNAICQRCQAGSEEFNKTDRALAAINKLVNDCNEGARKMERMEEICVLQTQVEFKTKPLALATPSRYLLRRGDIMQIVEDSKSPLKKLRPKYKAMYMFLFNDLLLLTKKKSENRFQVLDYATRNMTQVVETPVECEMNVDHVFRLVLLENSYGKTKEFLMAGNSETDKTRWVEAFKPPAAEQEGETVYASWDCPQVTALHNYSAQQPDELSLYEGDVINVLKKLPDGWYHGERLCDGTQGWFPANHTEEILNEHVRARNLRQRYRLLAASKHLIGGTLRL